MPERLPFDYAIVRIVPRVERGEFINAGAIVFSPTQRFLQARVELDRARLAALAPAADTEAIEAHLNLIPAVCRGGREAGALADWSPSARFHWLVAPRSTIVQMSPVHAGLCHDLNAALDELFQKMVKLPAAAED